MTSVAVAIGYYLVTLDTSLALGIAMLSAFLICAGGQAVNDVFDAEIDKKAKKKRPIPSGKISKKLAWKISMFLFFAGIMFSLALTQVAVAIAIVVSVMLYAYAAHIYKAKYIGNFVVALGTALPFVFGAAAITENIPTIVIVLSTSAFFANLGREVTKDFEDLKKDKGFKKTLPMISVRISKLSIVVYYIVAIGLGLFAYSYFKLGTAYLIITLLSAFVFLYTLYLAETGNYTRSQSISKRGMFIFLIALIAAILKI